MRTFVSVSIAAVASLALVGACATKAPDGPPGGPVTGAADIHCGTKIVNISKSSCQKPTGDAGAGDAGADAKAADDAGTGSDYGETMNNQSGADDDCKYDLSWASSSIYRDTDATFTVTVRTRADGKPVLGVGPDAEVFLDPTHAAPNTGTKTTEKGNGIYEVGPIRFDREGKWTIRFHLFDVCIDAVDSPHGHAAFYVRVP